MGQPSSKKNEMTIRHQFDRFCQKILHDEKVDYIREQEYRKQHEITLNEIPKKELDKVHVLDEYDVEYDHFQVLGYDIAVKDTLIAEALKELSDRKRNVILLSYFMEMSDSDIAKEMQLVRETIYLHRKGSIKILKKIIEEIKKDEENEFCKGAENAEKEDSIGGDFYMRLDELKNDFPDIPDFIHDMIQEEVEKQVNSSNITPIQRKSKFNRSISRVAAAAAVCIIATSTVAYAGTKLYHMYLEKQGNYGTLTSIKSDENSEDVKLPEEIHKISVTSNYIPKGMEWTDEENQLGLVYKDAPDTEGIAIRTALMDEKSMDKSLLDRNVIESENHVFGSYDGIYLKYNTTEGENSFDQRIYLLCPEEYRVLTLYIGNTISKEEAYKFAENIVITEEDEMIKTADMTAWSDIIDPTVYADKKSLVNGQLPVHQIGETFNLESHAEDNNGNYINTDKVTVRVDKIKVADDLQILDNDKIPDAWKTAVDANGKLVQNHLSYMKKGDGVNNLDSVVREENMNQKLLFTTVTYTNTSEEELNHMIYMGTLIALSKQDDGTYTIYMPGTEAGTDYDYYISDGVAKTAEMTYCSVQDDYGKGKNYIPSLKPGESVQVNMAWIVNEKDLENLYLNLNDTGGCYEISERMCHTGVVYVGKE